MSKNTIYKGHLLINEPPLQVLPSLAAAIGLNEALTLQQLHYLLQSPTNGKQIHGTRYIYNTYPQWRKYFSFWSVPTIKRNFLNLERKGLVKSIKPESHEYNQRKSYTIDYARFHQLEADALTKVCRESNRSKSPSRRDQVDPIEQSQVDPFKEQREQQSKIPPTPGDTGGSDSIFPGDEENQPDADQLQPGGLTPVPRKSKQPWAERAIVDPASHGFLELTSLKVFPTDGRQVLARAFVNASERGTVTRKLVELVAAVRNRINVPGDSHDVIRNFDVLVGEARAAAEERISAITRNLNRAPSDSFSLMQAMAAADAQVGLFTPGEIFGGELSLPFAWWLMLVCCIKRGLNVEPHKQERRAQVLEELAGDNGAVHFLQQIGIALDGLGIAVSEIEAARSQLLDRWNNERATLEQLLA